MSAPIERADPAAEWESYKARWSKRYLADVRGLVHSIAMIRSEIDELADMLDGISGIDYARDARGGADDEALIRRIERLDSLRAEYIAELDGCIAAQERAHRALANIGQPFRAVLTYRYIQGLAWADVADAVGYSEQHCKTVLHPRALSEVYPFIPHEFDDMSADALGD